MLKIKKNHIFFSVNTVEADSVDFEATEIVQLLIDILIKIITKNFVHFNKL